MLLAVNKKIFYLWPSNLFDYFFKKIHLKIKWKLWKSPLEKGFDRNKNIFSWNAGVFLYAAAKASEKDIYRRKFVPSLK